MSVGDIGLYCIGHNLYYYVTLLYYLLVRNPCVHGLNSTAIMNKFGRHVRIDLGMVPIHKQIGPVLEGWAHWYHAGLRSERSEFKPHASWPILFNTFIVCD